ncbi:MAG: hypothetical protein BGP01_12260 [Paludibacter sp. 47-17]|nr:MAG: hypothetical protein BGP01_12260 [Paludibacter sp. 47-17]
MTLTPVQITELKAMINNALQQLYDTDILLINRHAHERSIAFRFGLYFTALVPASSFVRDYNITVDFDYNRNGENVKGLLGFNNRHGVFPDVILHRRGHNDVNILVIEFKGIWNTRQREREVDIRKLIEFTHPQRNDYQYGLGAFVDLYPAHDKTRITYFINGEQEQ